MPSSLLALEFALGNLPLLVVRVDAPLSLDDPDDVDDEDEVNHHDDDDGRAQEPDAVAHVHPAAGEREIDNSRQSCVMKQDLLCFRRNEKEGVRRGGHSVERP